MEHLWDSGLTGMPRGVGKKHAESSGWWHWSHQWYKMIQSIYMYRLIVSNNFQLLSTYYHIMFFHPKMDISYECFYVHNIHRLSPQPANLLRVDYEQFAVSIQCDCPKTGIDWNLFILAGLIDIAATDYFYTPLLISGTKIRKHDTTLEDNGFPTEIHQLQLWGLKHQSKQKKNGSSSVNSPCKSMVWPWSFSTWHTLW